MLDNIPRYDMNRPPMRPHLGWLIWILSLPALLIHRCRIDKSGAKGVKPPYLLLGNHNAFMDFKVASHATWPYQANYVVAIDGFIKREWLLRFIGCICTRKFTMDMTLVRQLVRVVQKGGIVGLYPEARYSLCGTTAVLPDSIGKLAKLLKVPVVVLLCHGHHINSPFYHLPDHGVRGTRAEMKEILTAEDVKTLSVAEINSRIREAFVYDDFRWQQENHVRISYKGRAEGLHKVLYQCPNCGTEYEMTASGTKLSCGHCGKTWTLSEYGELSADSGETEFSHVPDWYEWERANVKKEVEEGRYFFESTVRVDALPNASGYIDLGKAKLTHSPDGFTLKGAYKGEDYEVHIPVPDIYSCHIEYEYLGKFGDCIDLNILDNTFYIYPEGRPFAVTKLALATEELYEAYQLSRKKN